MKIRSQFERERVVFVTSGDSRTHQSHLAACDVNNILAKYQRTGVMPPGRADTRFADVSDLNEDFGVLVERSRSVQGKVAEALNERRSKKETPGPSAPAAVAPAPSAGSPPSGSVQPPAGAPPAGVV